MKIDEVREAIVEGNWTIGNIDNMIDDIKWKRDQIGEQVKRNLKVGDSIKFDSRNGKLIIGTVTKINIKAAVIKTDNGNYNVPLSMLTVIGK